MAYIECATCKTKHRTSEQYEKHLHSKIHIERYEEKAESVWYINKISGKRGIFFQCRIMNVLYLPRYKAEEREGKVFMDVDIGENKYLSFYFAGKNIDKKRSFSYFISEIGVYTVSLVFEAE